MQWPIHSPFRARTHPFRVIPQPQTRIFTIQSSHSSIHSPPMALTTGNTAGGSRILCTNPTRDTLNRHCHIVFFPFSTSSSSQARTRTLQVAAASKRLSSRTGRFDSKNRRSTTTTTEEEQEDKDDGLKRTVEIEEGESKTENYIDDGFVMPDLPGEEPDFWEGPQWDALGFFIQYMWAFGIVFALIACGIAAVTYNEGATDFKETPAYKEAVQSREFLDEPDASNSDVFESNPTEVAPSLE